MSRLPTYFLLGGYVMLVAYGTFRIDQRACSSTFFSCDNLPCSLSRPDISWDATRDLPRNRRLRAGDLEEPADLPWDLERFLPPREAMAGHYLRQKIMAGHQVRREMLAPSPAFDSEGELIQLPLGAAGQLPENLEAGWYITWYSGTNSIKLEVEAIRCESPEAGKDGEGEEPPACTAVLSVEDKSLSALASDTEEPLRFLIHPARSTIRR